MNKNFQKIIFTFGIILFFTIVIFYLPKSNCCNDDDPDTLKHEKNVTKAISGDVESARTLYLDYVKNGNEGQAFTWLRIGAMNGANDLLLIYIEKYKKLPLDTQNREIEILNKNRNKDSVRVILEQINKGGFQSEVQHPDG